MSPLGDKSVEHLRDVLKEPDLSHTKYRLIRPLAAGGMGTVYLVEDTDLNRRVALKLLTVSDPSGSLLERMRREARVIARLEHPGIVPIHDLGTCADGRIYYVMKYVDGDRLQDAVRKLDKLGDRLRIFLRVCEAVAFAHSKGVIHRDLKPENIMVGPFGEVLVMDWGLAKMLRTPERALLPNPETSAEIGQTRHGSAVGTPGFMSPEQERGDDANLDERGDIFSLGRTLQTILSDLSLPRPLKSILGKATAHDPDARYRFVQDFAGDLSRFLDELPVSAHRENLLEKAARWISRNRFVVIIILAYTIVRLLIFLTSSR